MSLPSSHLFKRLRGLNQAALLTAFLFIAAPFSNAWAVCSNPAGNAGDIIYNGDENLLSYCDDTNWIGVHGSGSIINSTAPTSGLVGHWPLDETSGSTIQDVSPSANDGTWTDAVNNDVAEESTTGQVNNAIAFDSSIDEINLGNPPELQITGAITVAAWARPTSSHDGHIIAKWDWPNEDNASYRLQTDTVGGSNIDYEFRVYSGTCGSTSSDRSGEVTVNTNEWHHIVGVYEPSTAVRLYIDGVLVSEDTAGIAPSLANCANDVTIGVNTGPSLQEWEGDLDDVRVYNRALNTTEIENLYQATGGKNFGLSLHYKLDETGGTTVTDSSLFGNDGTWAGSPGISGAVGRINGSVNFYDNDWVVNAGSDASLDDVFLNGGTIAAWIRPTQTPFYDYGRVVSKMTDRPNNGGYSIYTSIEATAPQSVWFAQGFGGTTKSRWSTPAGSLNMQVWNHIAVVYDQETPTDAPTIYINGIEQNLSQQETGTGSADSDAAENFLVGVATIGNDNFEGQIDDIRVYRRMLSEDEIQSLAAACQEGSIIYNGDRHVPQYCAGNDDWVAMGPIREGIDSGLIGHWKLDETSGTTAGDSSGNLNNGSMLAGLDAASDSIAARVNTGLNLNGSSDYIDISSAADNIVNTKGSISAWVYRTFNDSTTNYPTPISLGRDDSNRVEFYYWPPTDEWWITHEGQGATTSISHPASTIPQNEWTHVVSTWDENADELKIFINGTQLGATATGLGTMTSNPFTQAYIGKSLISGCSPSDCLFQGPIDDVRIYDRAISDAEIMALYELGNNEDSSLVGHWKLDDLSGTTAADSSANNNTGTLTNFDTNPAWTSSGQVNNALSFDGVDDKIDVGTLFDYSATDFTIAGWIYADTINTNDQNTIFTGWDGTDQIRFEIDGEAQNCSANYLRLTYHDGGAYRHRCSSTAISEDTWTHVALVVDATNSVVQFYVNGTNDGANPALTNPVGSGTGNSTIGARTSDDQHFNGLLDDMRIYNRGLSATEINALYKIGIGNCTNPVGKEGDIIMGDIDSGAGTDNALMYCDGSNWQAVGKIP